MVGQATGISKSWCGFKLLGWPVFSSRWLIWFGIELQETELQEKRINQGLSMVAGPQLNELRLGQNSRPSKGKRSAGRK